MGLPLKEFRNYDIVTMVPLEDIPPPDFGDSSIILPGVHVNFFSMAVDSTGVIYIVYNWESNMVKSTDGGTTWSTPVAVMDYGSSYPKYSVRKMVIDHSDKIYLLGIAYDDGPPSYYADHEQFSSRYSTDGGVTWSDPVVVDVQPSSRRYPMDAVIGTDNKLHVIAKGTLYNNEWYYSSTSDGDTWDNWSSVNTDLNSYATPTKDFQVSYEKLVVNSSNVLYMIFLGGTSVSNPNYGYPTMQTRLWVSMFINGTWSDPLDILEQRQQQSADYVPSGFSNAFFDPDGRMHIIIFGYYNNNYFYQSYDFDKTYSPIYNISLVGPNPGRKLSLRFFYTPDGVLHSLFIGDLLSNGLEQVCYSKSADNGFTWTDPVEITTFPANWNLIEQNGENSSIEAAVLPNGNIFAVFMAPSKAYDSYYYLANLYGTVEQHAGSKQSVLDLNYNLTPVKSIAEITQVFGPRIVRKLRRYGTDWKDSPNTKVYVIDTWKKINF